MTPRDLEQILLKAKPFEPRALVLLRKHQAGEVDAISQIDRMRAVAETQTICDLAIGISQKLAKLTPVALIDPMNEFVGGFYL